MTDLHFQGSYQTYILLGPIAGLRCRWSVLLARQKAAGEAQAKGSPAGKDAGYRQANTT